MKKMKLLPVVCFPTPGNLYSDVCSGEACSALPVLFESIILNMCFQDMDVCVKYYHFIVL